MYLKCRHSGVYFLLFVISFPCRPSYYVAAQKPRGNVDDYGERLSSLERENRAPVKLSGVDHKYQEDAAQEEGMSLQDIPVVKLNLGKSSSKQKLSKEEDGGSQNEKLAQYTIGTEENTKEEDHEDKQLKTEENSKEQDHEDKPLKSEENSKEQEPDGKPLKSEENVNQGENETDNESKLDVTAEHESSTVKQNDDTVTLDDGPPTKCTTDREVTIGNYTPQDSQSNDEGHSHGGDSGGGGDGGGGDGGDGENKSSKGEDGHNEIDEDSEKKVSKVYKGPKPAKAPDHYIDDV